MLDRWRRAAGRPWIAIALGVAFLTYFRDSHFVLLMAATVLLFSTACLGLTVQFGFAGVANFAPAAFFGVGCYTAAVLAHLPAIPHPVVILLAGVVSAAIGSVLLLPLLRTRGHYGALVTIAFGILFRTFLEVNDALGGPQGLKVPGLRLFGLEANDSPGGEVSFYMNYVIASLAVAAGAMIVVRRLERSWIGISLDAVRLDETAAAAFGVDLGRAKILAFTFGNLLIGIAGAMYAMMIGFIAPNNFAFGDSLILVSIVLLGGLGNPWGVFPAAALVLGLPEKLQALQEYRFLLFSAVVVVVLLFRPQGLLPRRPRTYPAK
jgi:ABC-type branched-subunit amino acid transport system permease subunit